MPVAKRAHNAFPPKGMYVKSAQRVYAIRRALGFTQRDFAYFLQVAVPTVSNWETGRTKPSSLAEQMIRRVASDNGLDLNTFRRFTA